MIEAPIKTFKCKFCGVEVISKTNTHAIPLREHKKSCRRSKK